MVTCSRPECQTSAGCVCGRQPVFVTMPAAFVTMPAAYSIEQPTMQLRWYGGVLEQAFLRDNVEVIWRAVPTVGNQ